MSSTTVIHRRKMFKFVMNGIRGGIFQISPPMTYYWPKLVYLFSIFEIGMKIQMINSPQVWEDWAVLHKLHLTKLINLNILNTFIKKLMKTSKK